MAHSTYTTTQTGQEHVLRGDRQALSSSGRAGQARVLKGERGSQGPDSESTLHNSRGVYLKVTTFKQYMVFRKPLTTFG